MTREQRPRGKKAKGWKLPEDGLIIDRSSKLGNPFKIGEPLPPTFSFQGYRWTVSHFSDTPIGTMVDRKLSLQLFEKLLFRIKQIDLPMYIAIGKKVQQYDKLYCTCPKGEKCHGDTYIKLFSR